MTKSIKRVINTTDEPTTTTVSINSVTATVIAPANPRRMYVRISMDEGVDDNEAFIREYPAGDDNLKRGILLIRDTSSNHSIIRLNYATLPDNVYTGEISAISLFGTFNLHVTEG